MAGAADRWRVAAGRSVRWLVFVAAVVGGQTRRPDEPLDLDRVEHGNDATPAMGPLRSARASVSIHRSSVEPAGEQCRGA